MAAAVVAQVDDQAVAVALGGEVAVELGEAGRHHVGQVQVADAAAAVVVHPGAVALDPLAVARRRLVGQQRHQHVARGAGAHPPASAPPSRRPGAPAAPAAAGRAAAAGRRWPRCARRHAPRRRRRSAANRPLASQGSPCTMAVMVVALRVRAAGRPPGNPAPRPAACGGRRPSRRRARCRARPAAPRPGPTARRAWPRAPAAARSAAHTAAQSMPDMSATQKWSRCRRQTSRSICAPFGAAGRTDTRTRPRSSQPLLRDGRVVGVGLLVVARLGGDGAQALAFAHQQRVVVGRQREASALSISVLTWPVAKSNTSSRPGDSLWPPRPCAPGIGSTVHTTLSPATPAICPKRPSGTGNAATRRAMPSRSTCSGAGALPSAGAAPLPGVSSPSGFRPLGTGSNGGRPPACSATR